MALVVNMRGTLTVLIALIVFASSALAQDYDVVVLNGRVMNPETMFDAVRSVGIKDGIIATITSDEIIGKETIDATGHVVSPGFTDTHFHALDGLSSRASLRDGVTTGMDLELGAVNVDAWYADKEGKWPVNFGTAVSHEMARMIVHDGLEFDGPTDATKGCEHEKGVGAPIPGRPPPPVACHITAMPAIFWLTFTMVRASRPTTPW